MKSQMGTSELGGGTEANLSRPKKHHKRNVAGFTDKSGKLQYQDDAPV